MKDTGQIYLPLRELGLYVCIVLAVVLFRVVEQPGGGLWHRGDDRC